MRSRSESIRSDRSDCTGRLHNLLVYVFQLRFIGCFDSKFPQTCQSITPYLVVYPASLWAAVIVKRAFTNEMSEVILNEGEKRDGSHERRDATAFPKIFRKGSQNQILAKLL